MNDEPLNAKQAAEYLREKWGIASFTPDAFRQHRHRHKIKPSVYPEMPNSTLWTRKELDAIPTPKETKRRKPKKTESHGEDIDNPEQAMVLCA